MGVKEEKMRKTIMGKTIMVMILMLGFLMLAGNVQALGGDFNNDNKVNFEDFFDFAGKYNARYGDGVYQGKYDLNNDGRIDMNDFNLFSGLFTAGLSSGKPASGLALNSGEAYRGGYNYALNKVMVVPYKNRIDVHASFRNTGEKEDSVSVKVYLIDSNGKLVSRAVDSNVRLSLQEVHREIFTLEKPEKGKYIVIVEADNGRMNGYVKKAARVEVR